MKERPILMSAPMVQAILAGNKTQTRRIVNFKARDIPLDVKIARFLDDKLKWGFFGPGPKVAATVRCPYGQIGDRLWVRETLWHDGEDGWGYSADAQYFHIDIAVTDEWIKKQSHKSSIPSIHMPRWASRILLEVVNIRVERLQDISQQDACDEGVWTAQAAKESGILERSSGGGILNHRGAYLNLWEEINGVGSWKDNPYVWVIEFKVIEKC